jgi:hypothetical protein
LAAVTEPELLYVLRPSRDGHVLVAGSHLSTDAPVGHDWLLDRAGTWTLLPPTVLQSLRGLTVSDLEDEALLVDAQTLAAVDVDEVTNHVRLVMVNLHSGHRAPILDAQPPAGSVLGNGYRGLFLLGDTADLRSLWVYLDGVVVDGRTVARGLARVDVTGGRAPLIRDLPGADASLILPAISQDSRRLAYTTSPNGGFQRLHVLDLDLGRDAAVEGGTPLVSLVPGRAIFLSPDGARVLSVRQGAAPIPPGGTPSDRLQTNVLDVFDVTAGKVVRTVDVAVDSGGGSGLEPVGWIGAYTVLYSVVQSDGSGHGTITRNRALDVITGRERELSVDGDIAGIL